MCLITRYYSLNVLCQQLASLSLYTSYDLWHKTVLCGTKMSYALFLIMAGAPLDMLKGQNQ